jgi:uncharacterized membrane protein YgdD (TMEM256/DUF423 family)
MTKLFLCAGSLSALVGVITRSLSSHAIKPFLESRGKLDNFNLAADYLVLHGLVLLIVAILCHLFPEVKFQRAGWAFIVGSFLFQGTVLIKSCISIHPLGFLTPLGGFFLILGWGLLFYYGMKSVG